MRVKTVQINWHDKLPIFSVDFDHSYSGTGWRFATGGGDNNVRIWRLRTPQERETDAQSPAVEFLASLNRHTAPVNVVRFAPGGSRLASAGDDGVIIIWRQVAEVAGEDIEAWRPAAMLRGSLADICDLAWSPCGGFIVSASVDNTARIWDAREARCLQVLADHTHYVQGVAWDPKGEFLVTQSSDRSVRMYRWMGAAKAAARPGSEIAMPLAAHYSMPRLDTDADTAEANGEDSAREDSGDIKDADLQGMDVDSAQHKPAIRKTQRLFHDDNLASFFRRPSISPDGRLVTTAAGIQRDRVSRNTCYVWARDHLQSAPLLTLGGHTKPVVASRWAPCTFAPRDSSTSTPWVDLQEPCRMMLAVASQNAVALYDTSAGAHAVGLMSGLHYAAITDIAWCKDGSHLIIASIDGFASIASIEQPTEPVYVPGNEASVESVAGAQEQPQANSDLTEAAAAAAEVASAEAARNKGKKRLAPTFISTL